MVYISKRLSSEKLLPSQTFRSLVGLNLRDDIPDFSDTFQFVIGKLAHLLKGLPIEESLPPPLSINSNYILEVRPLITAHDKFD